MDSGIAWIVIFFFKNEKVNFISRIITIQLSSHGVIRGVCRDEAVDVQGSAGGVYCGVGRLCYGSDVAAERSQALVRFQVLLPLADASIIPLPGR